MFIYDSVQKKKVPFIPLKENEVKIYVCGPTVYDDAHLGHARSAIAFDLLRRVFTALGYTVTFVKNFTDIDDKIIHKMKESGKSLEEITSFYIERYKNEMHALHVNDADIEPKATESVAEIISFVTSMLDKEVAYATSDGIYFDTAKDAKYLSLSHRILEDDASQSRVKQKEEKKDQKDFALWKFSKANEPSYPAPFGVGRPGWHIECSAMIEKHLASSGDFQIDIHAGGADLLFPHHENEAAQTRCKSGQELAKYWMHNGFVTISGEKMSKSLGNSFFLKDALTIYSGEVLRFYLLATHYRANFNFAEEDLLNTKKRLDKLYRLKKRVFESTPSEVLMSFKEAMLESLSDDLNISKALASLDEMISSANETLDTNPKDKVLKATTHANLQWIESLLGIGLYNPYMYFQIGVSEAEKEEIEALIEQRTVAKKAKDFAKADEIRTLLEAKAIQLMDTAQGTQWEKVN
ncbi:cysteine--tRNA ligase [Sulfurospirillum multivorans]|uniref:Cysteine--tRNA ligase n=2 Tax=Sulfurospirillum multivorans TaxID=66821 RepID=A0AA86ALN0_SULMK|nr:cysteine--tRNA ligase [Sulfurospirillum multivorans]AHJ12734.1 cysteinyl-tRNA synthetase [Sulfurospirillum multivorans DSM 12446]QEH06229.1 cysteinyl-tRNA synthetase [Sulfurospirillum multivorans]